MDEAAFQKSSSKRGLALSMAFVLFGFIGYILNVSAETVCTRQTLPQAFVAAENRVLKNATIWSGSAGSRVTCVSKCHSLPACKSVNYYPLNRVCDLNNATRVDVPSKFVVDNASVYFDGNGDTPRFSVATSDHNDVHTTGFSVTLEPRYSDCQSLLEAGYSVSGIYTIFPAGFADGLRVYCDMETDGGGWLVIQRRQDGSVDFYRDWADYRVGFGDLAGEFWLGNDKLRILSNSSGSWDLRINLEDWDGNTAWAEYGGFQILGQDFRLSFDSYNVQSTAGDSLAWHNGQLFSTIDNDNDRYSHRNCAVDEQGAWWYRTCSLSNLNVLPQSIACKMEEVRFLSRSSRQVLVTCLGFYAFFLILPASQGSSCGHALSQEFSAAENRALGNATIWSGRVGTLVGCVSRCHSWQTCQSVNYFKNNRRCDLNNATRIDVPADNFVADYASVYFDGNGDTPGFSVATDSDCQSLLAAGYSMSGIYTIFPAGFADGLRVYCDMETDGGGWLVIQRRQDGSVDFYRGWADYRVGFGDLAGEFWLGNDNLRKLSNSSGSWDLRVDLEDWEGNTAWAEYGDFQISGQDFRLSFDSYNVQSTAGDSLAWHNGLPFSTTDNDNDGYSHRNCAVDEQGAWWYKKCSRSNLNGMYFNTSLEIPGDFRVIAWKRWRGFIYSLKSCSMKVRLAV
ncbi:uncharacterized protein LOC119725197 [Patiria miniata]|uniref:Fibrinogen C-terminal domain-containing protein n=1 Tax=Patiria miniata TaxID=46514 RepID=A0A913ZN60_PATMI|nr:uncharacterized protein LOC119725197 [Patiria miniata]